MARTSQIMTGLALRPTYPAFRRILVGLTHGARLYLRNSLLLVATHSQFLLVVEPATPRVAWLRIVQSKELLPYPSFILASAMSPLHLGIFGSQEFPAI